MPPRLSDYNYIYMDYSIVYLILYLAIRAISSNHSASIHNTHTSSISTKGIYCITMFLLRYTMAIVSFWMVNFGSL